MKTSIPRAHLACQQPNNERHTQQNGPVNVNEALVTKPDKPTDTSQSYCA